jgi:hypothetical protein
MLKVTHDRSDPPMNLITVSPVTSTLLGHGAGWKTFGIRFKATSYGEVTPSAGRSHRAYYLLDGRNLLGGCGAVQRSAADTPDRSPPQCRSKPLDKAASITVPPRGVQSSSHHNRIEVIDAPDLTSCHYVGAYARGLQLFADHLGNSSGSASLGAIGNQNPHCDHLLELP